MKKLLVIALALFALQATAQNKKANRKEIRQEKMRHAYNIKPQDKAQIYAKKLTLALDLTQAQQDKIEVLFIKKIELRKAEITKRKALNQEDKRVSQEERLAARNNRLDQEIIFKREIKALLNKEQYKKFSDIYKKNNGKHAKYKRGSNAKHKLEKQ